LRITVLAGSLCRELRVKVMSKRDRLLFRMRAAPHDIRFEEVARLLRQEGFVLFNRRGSHCTYHRDDGALITIVQPHGGRKTCHPADVRRLLELLGLG
jgi:predicted RNA binding protein YcfA (HicA-like mRNA interferase family)